MLYYFTLFKYNLPSITTKLLEALVELTGVACLAADAIKEVELVVVEVDGDLLLSTSRSTVSMPFALIWSTPFIVCGFSLRFFHHIFFVLFICHVLHNRCSPSVIQHDMALQALQKRCFVLGLKNVCLLNSQWCFLALTLVAFFFC